MEENRTNESQDNVAKFSEEPPKRPALPDEPPESTPDNIPDFTPDDAPEKTPQPPTETPATTGDVVGPEIDLPGEKVPPPNIELPPRPQGPRIGSAEQNITGQSYRWTYGEELYRYNNKRRETGVLTYAIVMTIAFALCFTLLLGVLLPERGIGNSRTIFVRNLDDDSGVLTIPEISEKVRPSVVCISVKYGVGSGVGTGIIMTEDGYIATNYHVIENGNTITVITAGTEYPAEVIGYDELSDLALLKINTTGLTPAEFGDSDSLIVGEPAIAIGTPAGLDYAETVTDGIISAINRNVKIYDNSGVMVKKMTLIQTNATVNPGNSGGPLINEYGQVIGIITMKLADNFDGIGFAIPINGALAILNEIKETGSAGSSSQVAQRRAILGILAQGVTEGENYELEDGRIVTAGTTGVIVAAVTPGYGADGKLLPGDIITRVDGKDVYTVGDVMDIVNNKSAHDSVSVRFYRDGQHHEVSVELMTEEQAAG